MDPTLAQLLSYIFALQSENDRLKHELAEAREELTGIGAMVMPNAIPEEEGE